MFAGFFLFRVSTLRFQDLHCDENSLMKVSTLILLHEFAVLDKLEKREAAPCTVLHMKTRCHSTSWWLETTFRKNHLYIYIFTYTLCSHADHDECNSTIRHCHPRLATCTNTIGSFKCQCIDGYTGSGVTCQGKCWRCYLRTPSTRAGKLRVHT